MAIDESANSLKIVLFIYWLTNILVSITLVYHKALGASRGWSANWNKK